jgi:hypothetical protein
MTSAGGTTWEATFTAADGVSDMNGNDAVTGRVYVVNVDESGDNHDVLASAYHDMHL